MLTKHRITSYFCDVFGTSSGVGLMSIMDPFHHSTNLVFLVKKAQLVVISAWNNRNEASSLFHTLIQSHTPS
jgi:hypothetical protein